MSAITLEVSHPAIEGGTKIEGFRFMWAYYVSGYDPALHCQPCFRGKRVDAFCTPTAQVGRIHLNRVDRYPYVYVCGVASGRKEERRFKNLHFPLKYSEGAVAEAITYNGYTFRADNAMLLPIPELPAGWEGKSQEHVRCKNFQFAVAYFGYPPKK
jgi:hypothetical protein